MTVLPSIFDTCKPRPEVLHGELPDSIFAAELWDVFTRSPATHADYREPARFFAGTHPTENMKLLVKDVAERLAGVEGGTPVYRLETGFGGGKTHSLISLVHVAREGDRAAGLLGDYGIKRFPAPGETRIAAFVGDYADPLNGIELEVGGEKQRTYTPWGQLAFLARGPAGYAAVKDNDLVGVAPSRQALEEAFGDGPLLLLLDELVLYMARAAALPDTAPRSKVNSQWPTFLQTLLGLAAARPRTALVLTLPSEQDANRKVVGELKQHLHAVMEAVSELGSTTARQARNLTPTQTFERAAVLGRRLFDSVDRQHAAAVADAYRVYLEQQRAAGVKIDGRGEDASYAALIEKSYPFHPELVRLFSERLAEIQDFQQTRGALRLVARTIRAAWEDRAKLGKPLLLQAQHLDLARGEIRDEILNRLKRQAFERGLDADVAKAEGGTHATEAETGWPWRAATEAAGVAFLHSLPDGSKGVTAPEVALALGRPGVDLHYVAKGLEETERRAWYMRREAEEKFLFRTRASINKRFQDRQSQVQPGEVRETLDGWIKEVYAGFMSLQVLHFPTAPGDIANRADKVRLAIIHYDKEAGYVGPGAGDKLDFVRRLFTKAGSDEGPRVHRNNLLFLLAEGTRVCRPQGRRPLAAGLGARPEGHRSRAGGVGSDQRLFVLRHAAQGAGRGIRRASGVRRPGGRPGQGARAARAAGSQRADPLARGVPRAGLPARQQRRHGSVQQCRRRAAAGVLPGRFRRDARRRRQGAAGDAERCRRSPHPPVSAQERQARPRSRAGRSRRAGPGPGEAIAPLAGE